MINLTSLPSEIILYLSTFLTINERFRMRRLNSSFKQLIDASQIENYQAKDFLTINKNIHRTAKTKQQFIKLNQLFEKLNQLHIAYRPSSANFNTMPKLEDDQIERMAELVTFAPIALTVYSLLKITGSDLKGSAVISIPLSFLLAPALIPIYFSVSLTARYLIKPAYDLFIYPPASRLFDYHNKSVREASYNEIFKSQFALLKEGDWDMQYWIDLLLDQHYINKLDLNDHQLKTIKSTLVANKSLLLTAIRQRLAQEVYLQDQVSFLERILLNDNPLRRILCTHRDNLSYFFSPTVTLPRSIKILYDLHKELFNKYMHENKLKSTDTSTEELTFEDIQFVSFRP